MSESEVTILTHPVEQITCPSCNHSFKNEGNAPFTQITCPNCKHAFPAPGMFNGFLLMECLGMGGMGGVFRAKDLSLNREVAIKVMQKSLGDIPEFIETFRREAQAVAKLNHPHIAQIYSFGEEQGQPFIVMELVKGTSLSKMMASGPVDQSIVMKVAEQIAEALKQAGELNIVHGDVKPENILLDENRNAKLVDFGIAALGGVKEGGDEVWGTPYYIAPEKVSRQKVDFRADMYSLGGTIFHAIAGFPPFDGPDAVAVVRARLENPPRQLKDCVQGIDLDISAMVDRLLKREPGLRYPTYDSLLADIRAVLKKVKPAAFGGKKFTVKTKNSLKLNKGDAAGDSSSGDQAPVSNIPPVPIIQPSDSEEERKRKLLKVILFAILGFVTLILLIIGGVLFAIHAQNKKKITDATTLQTGALTTARNTINAHLTGAQGLSGKYKAAADLANSQVQEIQSLAKKAIPQELYQYLAPTPPERKFYEPEFGVKKAPAEAKPAEQAVTNAPAAAEGATNTVAEVKEQAPAPEPEPQPEPTAVNDEPAQESVDLPLGIKMIQEVVLDAAELSAIAKDLAAWSTWLTETAHEADDYPNDIPRMQALAERITQEYNRIMASKDTAQAEKLSRKIQNSAIKIKREIQTMERTFKAKADADEKAKKAADDRAQADKDKAEKDALVRAETENVQQAEMGVQADVRAFNFVAARRKLNRVGDALKTEEGKAVFNLAMKRIDCVEAYQNYLIKKLPGYANIQKVDTRKIVFAGTGQEMKWEDLINKYPEQLVKFTAVFVTDSKAMSDLKISERTVIAQGAIIYLNHAIPGSAAVRRMVKDFAEQIIKKAPAMEEDIRKMIPESVFTPAN